jgi:8-oxo-dGTP pyrophosphatase MutT (NUDIX family)
MKILSFEKSVGGVLFKKEDGDMKFLLLKYRNNHWSFPKGHVEKNEKPEETLKREVEEETGICEYKIIDGFQEWEKYFYLAKGRERELRMNSGNGIFIFKKVLFFLAETLKDCICTISDEHRDYRWLSYKEALEQITYNGDKEIFKKAHDFLASKLV